MEPMIDRLKVGRAIAEARSVVQNAKKNETSSGVIQKALSTLQKRGGCQRTIAQMLLRLSGFSQPESNTLLDKVYGVSP
jgi:hypothetical protein